MPILAKYVGHNNLNKYYLEQALFVYTVDQPNGYRRKCKEINDLLNQTVKSEVSSGKYEQRVAISRERFDEIFA